MKLLKLMENIGFENSSLADVDKDKTVAGLSLDSRLVEKDFLFAAFPGDEVDGRDFIASAIDAGANSILLPSGSDLDAKTLDAKTTGEITLLEHDNPRQALAKMAGRFYTPQPQYCAAVTGTNGKTSVASFVRQLWLGLGFKSASIGTMGVEHGGVELGGDEKVEVKKSATLTTPDTIAFHKSLQELAKSGVDHVVFEASSHGLDQHRLDGVDVSVAAFSNLTRDHLDYHGSMENYFAAKTRLLVELLSRNGTAVINTESSWGRQLAELCLANKKRIITVGEDEDDSLRLLNYENAANGYAGEVSFEGEVYSFTLPLLGRFQLENALLAAGIVLAEGVDRKAVFDALANIKGVDGRMELAGVCANGAQVLIDYAHTPDGLENALGTLQDQREAGQLSIVFGCGGNRDKGKRPIMGRVAEKLADNVFVTDDNPRNEDPATIRAEVLAGMLSAHEDGAPSAHEYDDRKQAIFAAVSKLGTGDVLLVTGKGHEQGQIVAGKVLPFSDLAVVQEAIKACSKNNGGGS